MLFAGFHDYGITIVVVLSCQRKPQQSYLITKVCWDENVTFICERYFLSGLNRCLLRFFSRNTIYQLFFWANISKVMLHVLCFLNKKYSWKTKMNIRILLKNSLNQTYFEDYTVSIHRNHTIINSDSNALRFFHIESSDQIVKE